jgi:hypothetical protein
VHIKDVASYRGMHSKELSVAIKVIDTALAVKKSVEVWAESPEGRKLVVTTKVAFAQIKHRNNPSSVEAKREFNKAFGEYLGEVVTPAAIAFGRSVMTTVQKRNGPQPKNTWPK